MTLATITALSDDPSLGTRSTGKKLEE